VTIADAISGAPHFINCVIPKIGMTALLPFPVSARATLLPQIKGQAPSAFSLENRLSRGSLPIYLSYDPSDCGKAGRTAGCAAALRSD